MANSSTMTVDGHNILVTRLEANGAPFFSVAVPASISHTQVGQRIGTKQHYSIGAILKNGTVRVWTPAAGGRMFNKALKRKYLDAVKRELQALGYLDNPAELGPHPGTIIPHDTLTAGRSQDVSTPKGMREAKRLVEHAMSAKSYRQGYGLVVDRGVAKAFVKIDEPRVERLLSMGESPERIAYALLRGMAHLSVTTRPKFLKPAAQLREMGF